MENNRCCYAEESTDLMWVGEDLKVITTASGREEGAWKAPAIADVITRECIEQSGASGLSDVLDSEPGFFVSPAEAGNTIYLRGMPNAALMLNDSVPTGSGMNKNYNSINPYFSLESIKRIEIIKGPGSVLWGADALTGIVNIVPLTGKDYQGAETGLRYGSGDIKESAYFRWGGEKGDRNWFMALSGGKGAQADEETYNVVRFWGSGDLSSPVSPGERYGSGTADESEFFEFTGNGGFGELLKLSTNLSFYNMPYTRSEESGEIVWEEVNQALSGFIKLEGSKKYNFSSGLRWTAYMSWFDTATKIVDLDLDSRDRVFFGELVHEKNVWNGNGLITTGVSVRQEEIDDLPVWDNYYPDYFSSDNYSFLPWWDAYDYSIRTTSAFGQYQHTVKQVDMWIGGRWDDHEQSGSNVSYNTGLSWTPSKQWGVKCTYGNAYRTPVAKQLQEEKTDMENIETLSGQTEWTPNKKIQMDVTGFYSRLRGGYVEDSAIGLSEPINRDFYGIEFKMKYSPVQPLDVNSGISWVNSSGRDVHFRYNDYSYYENGQIVDHYIDIYEPYDTGPEILFNSDVTWHINKWLSARLECRYISEISARYLLDDEVQTYDDVWLIDAGIRIKDMFRWKLNADIIAKNILDQSYLQPGIFGPVQGEKFSLELKFSKRF
ncbi:TonB-dependent receptor domain-containing protein [uncultured Desulfobacter sp.]|uniref:TonB-dependent receptor plug domain-containing protein n=1 Tax=uncultured Desulfobacter sp. TaxID=240139 RepID=UPI002AAB9036|nr:TonB-dependent receptor [uncultured Desulfobacter sp.]